MHTLGSSFHILIVGDGKMIFEGSCTALVTPFNKSGEVNYFSLKSLIEYQLASNTKAIVILGTTGESPTITEEERIKIIKFCACLINKKIPLIVGTGSNSTKEACRRSKQAEMLGADAVLVVTPYYNRSNSRGIVEHYREVAQAVNIPVIAYNVPSRTGVNISPEVALRLSKIKNMAGIKEASGNLTQLAEMCQILPKSFAVYSGDDVLSLPSMSLGAKGVISVTSNCYPEAAQSMCEFALGGDYYNAKRLYDRLFQVSKGMFLDINPICVKAYLNLQGFDVGTCRLPLVEPSEAITTKLKEIKNKYEN